MGGSGPKVVRTSVPSRTTTPEKKPEKKKKVRRGNVGHYGNRRAGLLTETSSKKQLLG